MRTFIFASVVLIWTSVATHFGIKETFKISEGWGILMFIICIFQDLNEVFRK